MTPFQTNLVVDLQTELDFRLGKKKRPPTLDQQNAQQLAAQKLRLPPGMH